MSWCLLSLCAASLAAPPEFLAKAPPLPAAGGTVVEVKTEPELQAAVKGVKDGVTVMIAPGTYRLTSTLQVTGVKGVALRGATGNRDDVILVGRGMSEKAFGDVPHGVMVSKAEDVTIAHLTIRDVWYHPVMLQPDCLRPRVYDCRLIDAGEQFVKASVDREGKGVVGGAVEHTVMEYTTTCRSDYTNGVDVHAGVDWVIRGCVFRNIRAPGGKMAGPAVLMWRGTRGTLCEGNLLLNCQRGIAFGLEDTPKPDHAGGVIARNVFYRGPGETGDAGIIVWSSPGTEVHHNTVILSGTYPDAIEYRFRATRDVEIRENLTDGRVLERNGGSARLEGNVEGARPEWFKDLGKGDFGLRAEAPGSARAAGAFGEKP